jgi:5-oxoprolinase (ATP-hydrolysing)
MPGPACYGLGGPLTITDCNLALGRLRPEHFPRAFGPAGDQPIDCDAAHAALARLADAVAAEGQPRPDPLALAEGLVAIANTHMASAIRRISIARGHDPATHALVAFGGAGGQHACALAEALGIATILVHPMAGLLSALGIGIADLLVARERMLDLPLRPETDAAVAAEARALEAEALAALLAQGVPLAATRTGLRAHVRYEGSDTAIDLPLAPANELARAFAAAHQARFGFTSPETPLRIERLTAEARGEPPGRHALDGDPAVPAAPAAPAPAARARMRIDGRDHEALVLRREALAAGDRVAGPALVADSGATTLVAPGWTALVADDGTLILTRAACSAVARVGAADDPARLELHHARFMGIATDMGAALQASARSVNMKERLDFSCALFDAAGRLVANAPHIPVHLGAMGASVQAIAAARAADGRGMRPGDVYALNTPWNGGSHLPDITVVQPCFVAGRVSPAFFVAARGHHADIGGITPGSMPPLSRHIDEEGVLLDNVLLVEGGRLREAEMRALLASGPWPARNPERNIADLVAQVAACARGAEALGQLAAAEGLDTVLDAMRRVQDNAAEAVRRLIDRLGDGEAELPLDNGAVVRVAVRVDRPRRRLRVDFAGTSPLQGDNCNAPVSVTRAALLYVLRAMVDAPIPLNDGALEPVELVIPEGSLLAARHPSAVVAGNVETSQIVTDALFLALGAMAAAQGTMNNLTFGDGIHQYYETIAGGTGAGPGFDGASAVQSHMTNSRLTDPEILELRHPVRVERFAIRRGSGGPGAWRGGDGVVRRLAFLAPMTVALLSGRRRHAPPGLAGGAPGLPGEGWILRAGGAREPFGPTAVAEVHPGDEVEILTPGGGGYGPLP